MTAVRRIVGALQHRLNKRGELRSIGLVLGDMMNGGCMWGGGWMGGDGGYWGPSVLVVAVGLVVWAALQKRK